MKDQFTIQDLWLENGFEPTPDQEKAILHKNGPLYLPAGPGSGKTRVLLWRTLNLIVFESVDPHRIFLSTFTEKAALQLKQGLQYLLSTVTEKNGQYYDLANMYIGTVHAACNKMLTDRNFYPFRTGIKAPVVMDALSQYFFMYQPWHWDQIKGVLSNDDINEINGERSRSRHKAVVACQSMFNRFSEECIDPIKARKKLQDGSLKSMLELYENYLVLLDDNKKTDLSLLQKNAYELLQTNSATTSLFEYVIIDEYQDTNTIQEKIFFHLAAGSQNICVVGDDDQALYRFRGATVENFVQFPARCKVAFKKPVTTIKLQENFRSKPKLVDFYNSIMDQCDWTDGKNAQYRVSKKIIAHRKGNDTAVVVTTPSVPEDANAETATLVRELIEKKFVQDPNQIAFLYPSLKSSQVKRMIQSLEDEGLSVYAPRAGRLLEVQESMYVFGLLQHIFGEYKIETSYGAEMQAYNVWLCNCYKTAASLLKNKQLKQFVEICREELSLATKDYLLIVDCCKMRNWDLNSPYSIMKMENALVTIDGLSSKAKGSLRSAAFKKVIEERSRRGTTFTLKYIIKRATSVDWNLLDVLYKLFAFEPFKGMFDLAEKEQARDEGPICNLSIISAYLARFIDDFVPLLSADLLVSQSFSKRLFNSYLLALYRLQESEFENPDDPFPSGRIPFITIHQAKGLEFPVVVLGNPRKDNKGAQLAEKLVSPLLNQKNREPIDLAPSFDIMRMFYVALSRAENLLIINHYKGAGQRMNGEFVGPIRDHASRISELKKNKLAKAELKKEKDLPINYSYTGDFLAYQRCPRQYMIFHKYGFAPSRSQMMFFGSLVHNTLDELHNYLIAEKNQKP